MRPLVLAMVALAAAPVQDAAWGAILYATAASERRVDGFCLNGDGSLGRKVTSVPTQSDGPRRLVVGANKVLYVVEIDRVEAFQILRQGGLRHVGGTLAVSNMDPRDVALSSDRTLLYVTQNGQDRIVAYPLDAEGAPVRNDDPDTPDFTSCILGPSPARYQRLIVRDAVVDGTVTRPPYLYVASAAHGGGRISIFQLGEGGQLPAAPADCPVKRTSSTEVTCPISERRHLFLPRVIVMDGDFVYVNNADAHRILAFRLTNGLFAPPVNKKTDEVVSVCLTDAEGNALEGPFRWQKYDSRTKEQAPYRDMVLANGTLLVSQFQRGRVDAFRLKANGVLPQRATRRTREDVRGTPVGLAARGNVLYVAAGEFDRVQAFRLRNGLPDENPFSETDEEKDSFPNAVAVAETEERCD